MANVSRMDPILDEIERALTKKGLTAAAASKLAAGHFSLIKNMKSSKAKGARYSVESLQKLADVLDLEFYFGPPRDTDPASAPPSADPEDFAKIPLHAALLAAGDGRENGTEEIVDYLAFRRDWLRRVGVAPGNAALARVDGESMQPSIWHGDMVMIDRSRVEVPVRARATESRHRSPVYALLEDGHARVKRIERPSPDQLVLISDNPEFAPQFVHTGTVTVIGKVVWWGHTARE